MSSCCFMASHKLIMLRPIISLTNFYQFNHLHIREKDPSLLTTMVLNEHVVFCLFLLWWGGGICRVEFFFFFFNWCITICWVVPVMFFFSYWYITICWVAIFFSIDIPYMMTVLLLKNEQIQFSLVPHQWVSVSTHSLHKAEIQLQCRTAFTHTHTHTHTRARTHTNKTKKRKSACVNNVQLAIVSKKSCVRHFGKLIYPIISPGRRSALRSNKITTLLVVIKRRKKYRCIKKR